MSAPPAAGPSLTAVLWVGLGGFVGSVLRYLVGGWAQRTFPVASVPSFPVGTSLVNVLGCLAIGLVAGLLELRHADPTGTGWASAARLFLLIGVLGGFTTFSSFAWETLDLAGAGLPGGHGSLALAFANVALQVTLGLAAAAAGLALTRLL